MTKTDSMNPLGAAPLRTGLSLAGLSLACVVVVVVGTASVFVGGCGEQVQCTEEARAGMQIAVENEDGDRVCDATVVAVEDDFQETLEPSGEGDDCVYVGLYENPGKYTLQVNADGYVGGLFAGLNVKSEDDGCHVITVEKTVQITHDEQ